MMRGGTFWHWCRYHAGLEAAQTQVTEPERVALHHLAQGRECVVELGVFEGATSRVLRSAMSPNGVLHLVDPFFRGSLLFSYGLSIARREVSRVRRGSVAFHRKLSHEVAREWERNGQVDLLFIDADHAYERVRRDWDDWKGFVRSGGVVALHDSRVFPGGWVEPWMGPQKVVS